MKRQEFIPYLVQAFISKEAFKQKYPDLQIITIVPGIYKVLVPSNDLSIVGQIEKEVGNIRLPILFGLNSLGALQASNISTFHDYPFGELRGTGVLIGIVDTGINYTNKLFQYEDDTTRVVSIWDQTIAGDPPKPFDFGTVYTEEQINEALKASDPYTIVPSKDDIGHGTFLAGVAAGDDRSSVDAYTGAAPDAMLVVVKLRQASDAVRKLYFIPDETPAYQDIDILQGIVYVLEEGTRLNKPVVLLIGLGSNIGSHGGTTIMESFLETLTLYSRVVIVTAAGNEGNAAHHYQGKIETGGRKDIEVNVAEKEEGIVIQIWPKEADKVSVAIKTPIGQVIERVPIKPGEREIFKFTLQESRVIITYIYPELGTGGELVTITIEKPIPGIWQVSVYGDYIINGDFNMWLPRNGFINSNTRFTEPSSNTTVNIPATAANVIVVGAYDYIDGSIYAGSGRGPTTMAVIKPDLIAPGVNVEGPSLAGGTTVYIGTSTAAAVTAGACAILLQWAVVKGNLPDMNTRVARIMLIRGASRRKGVQYPNNIEGYGKLDLKAALELF